MKVELTLPRQDLVRFGAPRSTPALQSNPATHWVPAPFEVCQHSSQPVPA